VVAHVAQRIAELAHALPERAGQVRQALGTEHDQRDKREEQQMYGALDADRVRLAVGARVRFRYRRAETYAFSRRGPGILTPTRPPLSAPGGL